MLRFKSIKIHDGTFPSISMCSIVSMWFKIFARVILIKQN